MSHPSPIATEPTVAVLDGIREVFAARSENVAAVYLFGSVARGDDRADSDVDVGVLFVDPPPRTLDGIPMELEAALRARLGRPVDLLVLDRADLDLAHRVRLEGILVLEPRPERRVLWEVDSRRRFLDLQPHLRRYRYPEIVR